MSFTNATAMNQKTKRVVDQMTTAARREIMSIIGGTADIGKTEVISYALNGLSRDIRFAIIKDLEDSGYKVKANPSFDQRDSESITISWGHA